MQKKNGNAREPFMSPLHDPVFGAICANADVAGLAMESLLGAVLGSDGEALAGNVVSVTPQRTHETPANRGFRVDVEVRTGENEMAVIEVELSPERHMMLRNLAVSSHVFYGSTHKGDTVHKMAGKLPRVIHINIMDFVLRKDSRELVEPFKVMYTRNNYEVAFKQFGGYNVQLPNVARREPDFRDGLYAWCFTLSKAHREGKTVGEVLEMYPALKEYAKKDRGFGQFGARYKSVTDDPEERSRHLAWWLEHVKIAGQIQTAFLEGREEGIKEGIESAIRQVAANMLRKGRPVEEVSSDTGIPPGELELLKDSIANRQDLLTGASPETVFPDAGEHGG